MTEYEKMKQQLPFDPADPQLVAIRTAMRQMEMEYNATGRQEMSKRTELLQDVLDHLGEGSILLPNIHFDYGCNTRIGNDFFANVNSTFIDVAPIEIGDHVLMGPGVMVITATHPILPKERLPQKQEDGKYVTLEYAKKVVIGDHVWIGAGAIINPGVHIGEGSVIGSGSVVTKDIPPGVVAAGVPCRIIREITEQDSLEIKGY
ncbi:MAG: sugar O-acetyltransferase [Lachnospiraceae bacterium]